MANSDVPKLPIHALHTEKDGILLEKIAYKNPYDFTQKHRHSYYEIMFFYEGGG